MKYIQAVIKWYQDDVWDRYPTMVMDMVGPCTDKIESRMDETDSKTNHCMLRATLYSMYGMMLVPMFLYFAATVIVPVYLVVNAIILVAGSGFAAPVILLLVVVVVGVLFKSHCDTAWDETQADKRRRKAAEETKDEKPAPPKSTKRKEEDVVDLPKPKKK